MQAHGDEARRCWKDVIRGLAIGRASHSWSLPPPRV